MPSCYNPYLGWVANRNDNQARAYHTICSGNYYISYKDQNMDGFQTLTFSIHPLDSYGGNMVYCDDIHRMCLPDSIQV